MLDPRYKKLALLLVHHSCRLQIGEYVLIQAAGAPNEFIEAVIDAVADAGGHPLVSTLEPRISRKLVQRLGADGFKMYGDVEKYRMQKMQAFIGIRGGNNANEMSDVSKEQMRLYREHVLEPVHMNIRVPKTKWVILRWPNEGMAQAAQMSTEAFENFFFDVCTMDYAKLERAVQPLVKRMMTTDKVHIKGPADTDLTFSIKNIPAIPCFGERNIPDGECFTAPVRDSVNGVIHFNTPTIYEGVSYNNVRLEFKNGQVIKASCEGDQERLNAIFDSDEGARYVGEFSLAFNPYILQPMRDILFDEKIAGSLHFTPGQAYEIADNGNRSKIHWDLVLIQRPDYGGGEIWFDDQLVRKDGEFVVDELMGLNPKALLG